MGEPTWYSGDSNGHPSLHLMMGEVRQKLLGLCEDVRDFRDDTRHQFATGHQRMDEHESQIREINTLLQRQGRLKSPSLLTGALTIMSAKEWLFGLALGVLVLKGIVSPAEVKSWLLSKLTLP